MIGLTFDMMQENMPNFLHYIKCNGFMKCHFQVYGGGIYLKNSSALETGKFS